MKPRHLRPTPTSRRVGRAVTVPVVLLAALSVGAPAMAAKPASSTATASCSATPNPVAQNSDYTLTTTGLAAGQIVNVLVSDSSGTTAWQLQADSSGTTAVVGHAYWTGTSSVTVQKAAHHGWNVVASCSFGVV